MVHVPAQHLVDLLVGDVVGGLERIGPLRALHLPLVAIEDVGAGRLGMPFLDQRLLDQILDFLDRRDGAGAEGGFQLLSRPARQVAPPSARSLPPTAVAALKMAVVIRSRS